jgi:enamine deaminase RidA (YjgF/YER057c/UK114 family)
MLRKRITTGSPFEKAYGYSRAMVENGFCFVSGTTGYNYDTMEMPDDPAQQARNIFNTVRKVLHGAGFTMDDIIRAQYFVTDRSYCQPVLEVCGEVLGDFRPAAGIYIVAGLLTPEMKVEMEFTAMRDAATV